MSDPVIRFCAELPDVARYPDHDRRPCRVPGWETYAPAPQFVGLRAFSRRGKRLEGIGPLLDFYVDELRLGRVVWPLLDSFTAENFDELVAEIKRRNLFLFDAWGHVPGSAPLGMWHHLVPPPEALALACDTLGDHFLGIDNGEQDGRWSTGYARQQCPAGGDRFDGFLKFHRHFRRLEEDLGGRMTALLALTSYGHYFLKEGNTLLLGHESAHKLPCAQVAYAFIRGAGKQYGVPWFGNASVWNRWGYKTYSPERVAGKNGGPEHGTSLSLLKRLLYSHILYNCVIVGFEQSQVVGDDSECRMNGQAVPMDSDSATRRLSPLGEVQVGAVDWLARHGPVGVQATPVAFLMDHFSGWETPRHIMDGAAYRLCLTWGARPYEAGDYLAHALFDLAFPGYGEASYWRDERGFICPAPFGDGLDVLLSDAAPEVLARYDLLILANRVTPTLELTDALCRFVEQGGEVVLTGDNAECVGLTADPSVFVYPAGTTIHWVDGEDDTETSAFSLRTLVTPDNAEVLAWCGDRPAAIRIPVGRGCFTVLLSPFGLNAEPAVASAPPAYATDAPLPPMPHTLTAHACRLFSRRLSARTLFTAGEGLSIVACRRGDGEYTVGVFNATLEERPFALTARAGRAMDITELPLPSPDRTAPGWWPTPMPAHDGGTDDATHIAGGEVRIFRIRMEETALAQPIRAATQPPPPRGRYLALRSISSAMEALLSRPTFFRHFDGVKVDADFLARHDAGFLADEGRWLARQQATVVADFSAAIDFYPGLTLLDDFRQRYGESQAAFASLFAKAAALGAKSAIVSLHRRPENHCPRDKAEALFRAGLADLCGLARAHGLHLHLTHHPWKTPGNSGWGVDGLGTGREALAWVSSLGESNLSFAPHTGHAAMTGEDPAELARVAGARLGYVILSLAAVDAWGQSWDAHDPIAGDDLKWLSGYPDIPVIFDARYPNPDAEYADVKAWESLSESIFADRSNR